MRARVKRQGVDPAEEARQTRREAEKARRAEAEAREHTFKKLSEAYLAASARGFRAGKQKLPKAESTIKKERQNLNKHVAPAIGQRPISQIKRKEIVTLLEDIAARSGEDAANGCLEAIRRCFAYARHKELIENNPAIEISRYARPSRDVIASDAEIKKLWLALEDAKQPKLSKTPNANPGRPRKTTHGRKDSFASATTLQLALLTLQRRGELVAIHKDHIDWGKRLWIIPALNKKERRRGLVPLSPLAVTLLKQAFAHSESEWAFAGRDPQQHLDAQSVTRFMALPGSHTAKWRLLRCRTPPGTSDAFDEPERRRAMVVALLPNAARKAYGNSAGSKAASASSDTASSISTAFIVGAYPPSAHPHLDDESSLPTRRTAHHAIRRLPNDSDATGSPRRDRERIGNFFTDLSRNECGRPKNSFKSWWARQGLNLSALPYKP